MSVVGDSLYTPLRRYTELAEKIEEQFDTVADAQFVEGSKNVILYCVFTQRQFPGNLTIGEPSSSELHYLQFSAGKQLGSARIKHPERGDCHQGVYQNAKL